MFQVLDTNDPEVVSQFRKSCHTSLGTIRGLKDEWMRQAEGEGRLDHLVVPDRLASFAMIVVAGTELGRSGTLPTGSPESFLQSMGDANRRPPSSVFSTNGAREKHAEKERAYNLVEGTIQSIPGFDREALRKGEPQSEAFMTVFATDYYAMRRIAFEIARVTGTLLAHFKANEPEIFTLGKVYNSFEKSILHGLHADRVEALVERHLDEDRSREFEPG